MNEFKIMPYNAFILLFSDGNYGRDKLVKPQANPS
jgi:hypothetical protein